MRLVIVFYYFQVLVLLVHIPVVGTGHSGKILSRCIKISVIGVTAIIKYILLHREANSSYATEVPAVLLKPSVYSYCSENRRQILEIWHIFVG